MYFRDNLGSFILCGCTAKKHVYIHIETVQIGQNIFNIEEDLHNKYWACVWKTWHSMILPEIAL